MREPGPTGDDALVALAAAANAPVPTEEAAEAAAQAVPDAEEDAELKKQIEEQKQQLKDDYAAELKAMAAKTPRVQMGGEEVVEIESPPTPQPAEAAPKAAAKSRITAKAPVSAVSAGSARASGSAPPAHQKKGA